MANAVCRAEQEKFLGLAEKHLEVLRDVVRNSFDAEHRAIAAYVIGYAPDKKAVLNDLLYALRDPDDTVRNNAMRAMGAIEVLSKRKPSLEIRISPTWLIEMLNSLAWTDRNKAAVDLVNLTEDRPADVIGQLRERALPSLTEMAKWKHLAHALPGFILLGRIAGMEEKEIQDAWSRGEREQVVARAQKIGAKDGKR
jgi:HEAT repeat protein